MKAMNNYRAAKFQTGGVRLDCQFCKHKKEWEDNGAGKFQTFYCETRAETLFYDPRGYGTIYYFHTRKAQPFRELTSCFAHESSIAPDLFANLLKKQKSRQLKLIKKKPD